MTMTAESHPTYNRKCRACNGTIDHGTTHWAFDGGEDGFEHWECPITCTRGDGNCEGDVRDTPVGRMCGWHAATRR